MSKINIKYSKIITQKFFQLNNCIDKCFIYPITIVKSSENKGGKVFDLVIKILFLCIIIRYINI